MGNGSESHMVVFHSLSKRQPTEREKIFANEATNKGLLSKILKQLTQLKIKKKRPNQKTCGRPK